MSESATAPAFELRDVEFRYSGVTALAGLTLDIPQGQRVVLLGANGSGKSTLLRLLDALCFPSAGSIRAFGAALLADDFTEAEAEFAFRRRVGFVFQNPDVQLFNATVFDELAFGPLQLGWPAERIRERVEAMLTESGLSHLRERSPHRLSGGEKKRVALAATLIVDPEVLLLDEPTAFLDPESGSRLIETLIDWSGGAKTLVMATHDLDIVEDVADRVAVLQAGRLAAQGSPAEILGDFELLRRCCLVHAHRHVHGDGSMHLHHHVHRPATESAPGYVWRPAGGRK